MGNTKSSDLTSMMPDGPVEASAAPAAPGEKPKCKACCACPETKRVRDACIVEKGEENCGPLIEEHKACMRKMGFNI